MRFQYVLIVIGMIFDSWLFEEKGRFLVYVSAKPQVILKVGRRNSRRDNNNSFGIERYSG
jgi:hypothetical protein